MKKFLFIALAAMGFAACENVADDVTPNQSGEKEQSYVAITLAADDITRATNGNEYEIGLKEERAVKSAYIFFFQNGKAFTVTGKQSHPGELNYINVADELTGNKEDMDNVSDVKDAVLVLEKYKGEYPTHAVAVLNWTPQNKTYTLDELRAEISTLGSDEDGYVMSNSVYEDNAGQVIDAVAITESNIAKDAETAKRNPIVIHVERVAAKVVFTAEKNGKFEVGKIEDTVSGTTTTVSAQITGFELYNDYETSWLIKKINPNWETEANFGFSNWNDFDWYRSYWATSLDTKFPNNSFAWNTDNTKFGDEKNYVYCGENTRKWSLADDVRTKVIVKARLVDENDNAVEVVNWWGKEYVGEENLKIVVANTLVSTYFTKNGEKYVGLTANDIKCVGRNPQSKNAYEVYFVIDDASKSKDWYKYEKGTYNKIDVTTLNKELEEVQPALVYNDGMTYYYTDIKHLGTDGSTTQYGVVRNHVYKVKITDIKGYGTPVYNGEVGFITPEKPVDINTFVAAQINILSWRVVENDYPLN